MWYKKGEIYNDKEGRTNGKQEVTLTEYIFLPFRPLLSELDETIEAVDVGLLLWAKHLYALCTVFE